MACRTRSVSPRLADYFYRRDFDPAATQAIPLEDVLAACHRSLRGSCTCALSRVLRSEETVAEALPHSRSCDGRHSLHRVSLVTDDSVLAGSSFWDSTTTHRLYLDGCSLRAKVTPSGGSAVASKPQASLTAEPP